MKLRLTIILFFLGLAIILAGFVYDVLFAGIPYPDPTPALTASYNFHALIASIIRWSGLSISAIGAVGMLIQRWMRVTN
jgi:hypothetical protein